MLTNLMLVCTLKINKSFRVENNKKIPFLYTLHYYSAHTLSSEPPAP